MVLSKKLQAFLIHLGLSLLVASLVLILVLWLWYPAPLASATGVTHIILMLISFDVILGPLLTLLVYQEHKKSLKFDLSCIVVVQLLAFAYGLYTVAQPRPVWIVQTNQMFQLVAANSVQTESLKNAQPPFQKNSWTQPRWVATNDQNALQQGILDPAFYPEFYITLESARVRIQQKQQPLDRLFMFNEHTQVEHILAQYPNATAWMPLRTTGLGLVVLLDQQQNVVATVDLRPWQE